MTTKERAALRSLASAMDTVIMVGKGGVTQNVADETARALLAHELIKGKVLETAPLTSSEALAELARLTDAEPVQAIGSKFVLYKENRNLPEEKRIKLKK